MHPCTSRFESETRPSGEIAAAPARAVFPVVPGRRRSIGLPAALLATLSLGTLAAPALAADRVDLAPCHLPDLPEQILCGRLDVPENVDDAASRRIPLRIVVVPAKAARPAAEPLFVLAGGPGQAATDLVAVVTEMLDSVRRKRDLVFVDQRGTGDSNPLGCELGDPLELFSTATIPVERITSCRDTLSRRADLKLYTTFHAMPDLDRIREALGYERIALWGGSYGTRAALVYASLFPERTHALVLDGTAPFEAKLPLFYARDAQRALDLLFEACASDPACAEAFPDPRGELEALLADLREAPRTVRARHPSTGEPVEARLTAEAVASSLRNVLYLTSRASLVPLLIRETTRGNAAPLLALGIAAADSTAETMSLGMTLSVLCSEDLPRIRADEEADAVAGTFLGRSALDAWKGICAPWPRAELPEGFDRLATMATPALLLSGEVDPVVPPSWADRTAELLPESVRVVVPGMGHNVSHVGCVPERIAEFLERVGDGPAAALDIACVERVERPPFVTSFAGPEP